jgi:hypothetical protein
MSVLEALVLFVLCLFAQTLLGIAFDWLNFRLGEPWYSFPSRKMYYVTFTLVVIVFAIGYWIAFLILPFIV